MTTLLDQAPWDIDVYNFILDKIHKNEQVPLPP